jgi:hypothetical protein
VTAIPAGSKTCQQASFLLQKKSDEREGMKWKEGGSIRGENALPSTCNGAPPTHQIPVTQHSIYHPYSLNRQSPSSSPDSLLLINITNTATAKSHFIKQIFYSLKPTLLNPSPPPNSRR